ncbi:MAG: HlyD family efflux transporter periplasmic adaptor subunit [Polyangiaceae bacterium]|nr:HlyD family efflux transporter periplasmic adaptor subunit [Polyangiaceae bacterium]
MKREPAPAPNGVSKPARPRRAVGRIVWQWTKRGLLVLAVVGVVAAIATAWMPQPVPVDLATVEKGRLEVTVDEDGRTRVKNRYVVSAPLTGNLARIELEPGDAVEEGTVLARLVPLDAPMLDARSKRTSEAQVAAAGAAQRQAAAQIERARAALDFARREAVQQRALRAGGASTDRDVERAELEERTAEAELTSAEFGARVAAYELEVANAALGRLKRGGKAVDDEQLVLSPVRGRVLKVVTENEGVVQAGSPLVEIGDPGALEIAVDILTSDAVTVKPGCAVTLEHWGGGPLAGRVRLVEPSAFTRISSLGVEEQRVNAVIELSDPFPKWSSLGDGYRVEARIVVWSGDGVLSVPVSAVFRSGSGWAVFAVEGDRAHLRPVEIGRRTDTRVEIRSGLETGATVVSHPSDRVKDGIEVTERQ